MSFRIGRALGFAILIWLTEFIWGSIVFMMPSLKSVASMRYVSRNPAISFPLLILWPVLIYLLARNFLKGATNKPAQGIKLGLVFWIVNFCLDLVVLVFLLKTGFDYFASLTVWIAYGLLLILPWLVGRSLEKAE
jgi:hypothetical protein